MASTGSVGSSTSSPGANSSRPAAGGAAGAHRSETTHATTHASKAETSACRPAPADSVSVSDEASSHHPEPEASVPDFGWASPSEIAEADAATQRQRDKDYRNLERQVDLALGGDGTPRTHDQEASTRPVAADDGRSVADIEAEIRRQRDEQLRRATDLINP